MALRRRISQREFRTACKGQLDGLSFMAGKAPIPYGAHIPVARGPNKPSTKRREHNVNDEIRDWQDHRDGVTLWRNNRGDIPLENGKRIRYGVGPNGASDWIGYVSIVITPEMVGQRIAQFTAVESKAPRKDTFDAQEKFINRILAAGGRAGVARSADDAERIIS